MSLISKLLGRFKASPPPFDYKEYWEERYRAGGNSGLGSYGQLAQYKADVINQLIARENLVSVVEFGCGDGNQLGLMHYPQYLGLDISPSAVEHCRTQFAADATRRFEVYHPGQSDIAKFASDLALCLDVLYHIIEEEDFCQTLADVLRSANHYAILYTNLEARNDMTTSHIRWRDTLEYLHRHPEFEIEAMPAQPYPKISAAQFFILKRTS